MADSDSLQTRRRDIDTFIRELDRQLSELRKGLAEIGSSEATSLHHIAVSSNSDTQLDDDTSRKRITLQRRSSPPSNAAYIEFTNSPGAPGMKFYLVLEEE